MRRSGWMLPWVLICATFAAHAEKTVTYYYSDPQGTPLAETDSTGNVIRTLDYRPYGVEALGFLYKENDVGYTGHVSDDESNLVYMQARYYDASIGRFLSLDSQGVPAGNIFFSIDSLMRTILLPATPMTMAINQAITSGRRRRRH